jgi:hypothetical protein
MPNTRILRKRVRGKTQSTEETPSEYAERECPFTDLPRDLLQVNAGRTATWGLCLVRTLKIDLQVWIEGLAMTRPRLYSLDSDLRRCRCVPLPLRVIQPIHGSFQLFQLAVDTLGSYLMSDETSIFSVHWNITRHLQMLAFGSHCEEAQFRELAISATAQSSTFVTRDQSLKDLQS